MTFIHKYKKFIIKSEVLLSLKQKHSMEKYLDDPTNPTLSSFCNRLIIWIHQPVLGSPTGYVQGGAKYHGAPLIGHPRPSVPNPFDNEYKYVLCYNEFLLTSSRLVPRPDQIASLKAFLASPYSNVHLLTTFWHQGVWWNLQRFTSVYEWLR